MKYAAVAIALAGVVAAQNSTTTAPLNPSILPVPAPTTTVDVYTTLTICDFSIVTVTACPAVVVDCPADQQTITTTVNYVPVTTTVCPVASYDVVVAALPATQTIYPGPTPAPVQPGYPGVVSPVAPVPAPPANVTAPLQPFTGAGSMVSGSIGAVFLGLVAALAL